jgi:hypothetical protein
MVVRYIFPPFFGIFYQEKSGNPGRQCSALLNRNYVFNVFTARVTNNTEWQKTPLECNSIVDGFVATQSRVARWYSFTPEKANFGIF